MSNKSRGEIVFPSSNKNAVSWLCLCQTVLGNSRRLSCFQSTLFASQDWNVVTSKTDFPKCNECHPVPHGSPEGTAGCV